MNVARLLSLASLCLVLLPGATVATASAQSPAPTKVPTEIIGRVTAADLDLDVVYCDRIPMAAGENANSVFLAGTDMYVVFARHGVARIDRATGKLLWRRMVAHSTDRILGIDVARQDEGPGDVLVTCTTDVWVLDRVSGAPMNSQELATTPCTGATLYGPFLIYGTKTGRIQWQHFMVGAPWRTNALRGAISPSPVLVGDRIAAASEGGTVIMLDADNADEIWTRQLSGGVRGALAFDGQSVFVGCDDQYIYSFDARNGRVRWKHFSERPVRASAVLLGDALCIDTGDRGMMCFEAYPATPIATVRWSASALHGTVVARTAGRMLLWDAAQSRLCSLDANTGAVVRQVDLPDIAQVTATDPELGELIVLHHDGRVETLRAKGAAPTSSASPVTTTAGAASH